MNDLLKQGYTMEEVIELFKKHGNDLRNQDVRCYHIFSHFQTDFYLDFYKLNGIQSINDRTLQTDKQKQK